MRQRKLILAGLWLFILVVLITFRGVVLPFAAAALVAYLVAPIVNRMARIKFAGRGFPRWLAILVIYAVFFVGVYVMLFLLVPQIYRELARISRETVEYANSLTPERIRELSRNAKEWMEARGVPIVFSTDGAGSGVGVSLDIEEMIRSSARHVSAAIQENLGDILKISRNIVTTAFAVIFSLFFVLMVAAFFSVDFDRIKGYLRTLVPPENAEDVRLLVDRIDRALSGIVRGQFTICAVNGTLTFIGLSLFGLKFAFVLATMATVLSLIPIFGTIISSVPIVVLGLSQSVHQGLAMLLWIIGIHALEAYFLNPKIMGSAARIHPIVVAFALIAGETTFGIIGALFAVPLAAIVVACFDFARLKALPPAPAPTPPAAT